jgi:NADPH-dependent 2,4-dienoyl-CoA reductase/sulfur reductase-like enzyme/rhodanese-related sulfurtransferase
LDSNQPLRIVIVGGVAGGASAATRARRVNADAEITIFEKGPAVSFANCGLPYHVGGEIADRAKLLVATPELFWKRFRIAVQTHHEVVAIDRVTRSIRVVSRSADGEASSESIIPYDRLILATGAEPVRPPFAREMPKNAFHLWTLSDMDHLMAYIEAHPVKRALVIGAGFVGVEVVEQFHRRGLHVDLVERNPQVLTRLDPIFAKMVSQHMESKGVRVLTSQSVSNLELHDGQAKVAILESGKRLETDLVVIGAGVRPRTSLAADAELAIGPMGGIVVNDFMQTSDPSIYAVGDAVEYTHAVTGTKGLNPLAGPANRSGRIAGEHAGRGSSQPMGGVLGTSIVRVFDVTAASTGLNEKQLTKSQTPFRTAIVQAASHASYFPGAQSMQLKLLYAPNDGRILGGQAVGGEGVDKRIDVVATAMAFQGTVYDLAKLDLAYAPPYGSAKDPIHMAAFTAINDLSQLPKLVNPDVDLNGLQVIDVRTERERQQLPLPGAIAIEIDAFAERWQELDPMLPTVVVCHSGKRAHIGASWLASKGFRDVSNLTGGMSVRSVAMALRS